MAQLEKDVTKYHFYKTFSDYIDKYFEQKRKSLSSPDRNTSDLKSNSRQGGKKFRKAILYCRLKEHYLSSRMSFLFSAMMGNGADGLTQTIPLTFALSMVIFATVRLLTVAFFLLPLMKLEIFLGQYTKLTNGQFYRMAPLAFGLAIMNFILNFTYIPILMTEVPILLLSCLRIMFNSNFMTSCITSKHCFDYKVNGSLKGDNCSNNYLSLNCQKNGRIAYVGQHYFWYTFYDYDNTFGDNYDSMGILLACTLSFIVLLGIVLSGIRCIQKMFVVNVIAYIIIMLTIALMVVQSKGASNGLVQLFSTDRVPTFKEISMVIGLSTINLKLITPVGLMTYKAFTKKDPSAHHLSPEEEEAKIWKQNDVICFFIKFLHFLNSLLHILVIAQMCGALAHVYGVKAVKMMFVPRIGMYTSMFIEFLHYKEASTFFIICFCLCIWGMEITKLAITMHFQILNLIDFFPIICKFQHYVRVAWGTLSYIFTLILTYKHIFWFLPTYNLANVYFIESVRLFAYSFILFYVYGIKRLEDDILFATGKRVVKIWRILWPIYPILNISLFVMMTFVFRNTKEKLTVEKDSPNNDRSVILLTALIFLGSFLFGSLGILHLYIIKRVGYASLTKLTKPDFYWGPPTMTQRRLRKLFNPKCKIGANFRRDRIQRFRQGSIRQMHEEDILLKVTRGRIFLDSIFYSEGRENNV